MEKGLVCVTGGTGYVASWLIMRLLQHGYAVNTTIRSNVPDQKKDVSYLTNLPGASERLQIFNADLDKPESFNDSFQGCVGVFHVAHTIDFEGKEGEETVTKRSINATISILRACLESKTVKRVVYTSSESAVKFNGNALSVLDETSWTDVDFVRSSKKYGGPYYISKTLTERAALEFAETHGLDLVTVVPTFIHGPFITPHCPGSVRVSMSPILGDDILREFPTCISIVHVDDVASAHIFLFEYLNARGRYICSAVDITVHELQIFIKERYPEYNVSSLSLLKHEESKKILISSKKLLDTGFEYKYGLEQMYDDATECFKQKGLLSN
ncbi:Vestitone reductase [Heracleum sosnowskyi]|uniref:Dihydroflavonol 4-reductase n=1 Tax=Heracleum sosnowskyi TaxID=360622 RepID=A0AAD8N2Y7_9APIA|nr:Vestitone reductase [Heracleum sosnowskyi]